MGNSMLEKMIANKRGMISTSAQANMTKHMVRMKRMAAIRTGFANFISFMALDINKEAGHGHRL